MNIVILGAGEVGSYLAMTLSQEDHSVTIIDQDYRPLEKIAQKADIAVRHGSGTDWKLLEELLEFSPDLFIALSSNDETNLIACSIAKNLGYPKTVARIRQSTYLERFRLDFGKLFFVDHFIGTELIVAHDLCKRILHPGHVAVETFAHGAAQMRTFLVPPQWAFIKKKIADLPIPDQMLISLIFRKEALHSGGSTRKVIFPKGFDHLLAGDEITVIGEAHVMQHLEEFFGLHKKPVGSVTIAGASPIAFHLTRLLLQQKIQVKILEKEEKKCLLLSDEFPTATILNQDATDLSFLLSQEKASDAFICCMLKDETNILIAALAKQAGYEQVLTLISDSNLAPLLKHLGVSYSLSEKVCIGNRIHSLLKQETVLSISSFYENQVKILEVKVSSDSQIVGIPIRDLKDYLPQDLLIALIENRGRILVAKGNHILAPGDTVIVVCSPKHMSELENLF